MPMDKDKTQWPSDSGFEMDRDHYIPRDDFTDSDDKDLSILLDKYYDDIAHVEDAGHEDSIIAEANDYLESHEELESDVVTLPEGKVLMRYVDAASDRETDTGKYFTEPGTPVEELALKPDAEYEAHYYKLNEPVDVHAGAARSWFGEEGGGVQYKLLGNLGVNDLKGLDDHGEPVEGKPILVSECDENGELIDNKPEEKTEPLHNRSIFQKAFATISFITGLTSGMADAKKMPNKTDMHDILPDTSQAVMKDNKETDIDLTRALHDCGYETKGMEPADDEKRTLADLVIDAGQLIKSMGSDEDEAIDYSDDEILSSYLNETDSPPYAPDEMPKPEETEKRDENIM